jgi:WD40 repeat protein
MKLRLVSPPAPRATIRAGRMLPARRADADPQRPVQLLRGHLHEITAVAMSKKGEIVSASEDKTVRVWDGANGTLKRVLHHSAPVRAVTCKPPGTDSNLCLTAGQDGVARLYDLDTSNDLPVAELRGGHAGPITCVAFSPQGRWCATGGEDRAICLWDSATAKLQRFAGSQRSVAAGAGNEAGGHRGAVTWLAFLSARRLVSAGNGKMLLVWDLNEDGARVRAPSVIDRRGGDVAALGVSPADQAVLFDYGRELRVLTVPDKRPSACCRRRRER